MITARTATQGDFSQLSPLYADFFREDHILKDRSAIEINLEIMLADSKAVIFVAEVDDEIIGFSSGSATFGVEFGWAVELEDLYVTPTHRGKGYASHLANSVADWARSIEATEILLVITPEAETEQGLTRFYSKLGYRDSRRVTMYKSL